MPDQASTMAAPVDYLYLAMWAFTIVVTAIISTIIIVFAVKYRRRSIDEIPRPIHGAIKLETALTGFTFVVFMVIFVAGAAIYYAQYRIPPDTMDVHVVGKQWMWKFQHPTGQREINELHVPMGTKVKLTVTTEDVIHSLYFPAFRIKTDAVPGRYTSAWFEATKEGTYHIFCSEYCGTDHSKMRGRVIVMKPTDYEQWVAGNLNQVSPVEAGRELYNSLGCASCHGANSEGGRCPPLINLYGKQVALQGGTTVTADEDYIRESIINPAAKGVAGYPLIMPTYQGQVTEEQLLQLVSYIKSLAPSQTDGIDATAPARENNPRTGAPTIDTLDQGLPGSEGGSSTGASGSGTISSGSGAGTGSTGQSIKRSENRGAP